MFRFKLHFKCFIYSTCFVDWNYNVLIDYNNNFKFKTSLKLWVYTHSFLIHNTFCGLYHHVDCVTNVYIICYNSSKFKTCLKLWEYSLSDPFQLQTTSSLLLLSLIKNPQCTIHWQCYILFGSTLMVLEASQSLVAWQLQCPRYQAMDTIILGCWCFQHLRTAVLLYSWSVVSLLLLCVTHTLLWFEPVRAFTLWIPVEMCWGPTSTTSVNLCFKFKPDRAGIVNF